MEVKTDGKIPLWLCRLMSDMGIQSTSFSKYGTEFKRYAAHKHIRASAGSYNGSAWIFSANLKRTESLSF